MTTRTTPPVGTAPGSAEDILRRVRAVPAAEGFPAIDELLGSFAALAAEHPDLVQSRRIGTSRRGEPIPGYTIGAGERSYLVVGGVHPNEPIGFLTALHLATELISDPGLLEASGGAWHIVPCIDPDGARLNEGWYATPQDRNFYSRRFYRPEPDQQVEWTFPTSYKNAYFDRMMPETQALAREIDRTRPDLYVALHNGEMGGVYYYLSRPVPALHDLLHAIPAEVGLPLNTGEPESPYLETYAPAIYGTGSITDAYDYLEGLGLDPTSMVGGSSSSEYAERYGTLSLVAELPYWTHPDSDDQSPAGETYRDLVTRTSGRLIDASEQLGAILAEAEEHVSIVSPFLTASRVFVPMLAEIGAMDRARAAEPESERGATIAERFGNEDLVHCFRLRYGGMLLRALEAESVAGVAPAPLRRLVARLESLYAEWQVEAATATTATVIPVADVVGVQYGALLAAAFHGLGADD
ncbi:M14 family zinc carboxypeptidase [Salinibacterium soli]|uniref:M14 family zinc carboxypeptidase n=1 Tax=Antiquaquibacter soli TaxID=3064523 RepID=A0ABT9BMP2_9MICO|nr:M14 family zinc carboxypeptidase [Protaetiibacter sp. WY-16]MDO7882302.1 M14 family zinc carboxypeptidase [Protaetiibacter sp. WY-16]